MKEHANPNQPVQRPASKGRPSKMGKRWCRVNSLSHPNDLKIVNDNMEVKYHCVLKAVKHLLPPNTQYFERNYKYDASDPLSMHTFVCDHIYLHLECDYHYDMRIEHGFNNFGHEEQVLKMLKFPIYLKKATNKMPYADLPAFFKRIVAFQEPKYIHFL